MIIPLFQIKHYSFVMRASIPGLFLVMYFVMRFLVEEWNNPVMRKRKIVLIITLCIGACTPMTEINRGLNTVFNGTDNNLCREDVGSMTDIQDENTTHLSVIKKQFFVYDYEDTPFFKYLAK